MMRELLSGWVCVCVCVSLTSAQGEMNNFDGQTVRFDHSAILCLIWSISTEKQHPLFYVTLIFFPFSDRPQWIDSKIHQAEDGQNSHKKAGK